MRIPISLTCGCGIAAARQRGPIAVEAAGTEHRYPYQAHRLPNGNTLVSLANPGEVVEVDKMGSIVLSVGGNKMDLRLGWVSGTQPLPNGGLLLADYTGRRLLELDASGKVLHSFNTGSRAFASVSLLP